MYMPHSLTFFSECISIYQTRLRAHRQVTLCTASFSSSLTRSHLHIINPHMETLLHMHQKQQRPSLKIQSIVSLAASHIVLMMTTCPWKLSLSRLSYVMCLTLTCQTCRPLYPDEATNLEWEHFINNYTPVTTPPLLFYRVERWHFPPVLFAPCFSFSWSST